eukprot:2616141-Heterocapsa_arctica.AAC.1
MVQAFSLVGRLEVVQVRADRNDVVVAELREQVLEEVLLEARASSCRLRHALRRRRMSISEREISGDGTMSRGRVFASLFVPSAALVDDVAASANGSP